MLTYLLFVILLALWGVLNLWRAMQRSVQPTLRQERLFTGIGGLVLALSLEAFHAKHTLPAWILLLIGLVALLARLISIYRQSLHNTTM